MECVVGERARGGSVSPSTYLTPVQLSSLRRRLADELIARNPALAANGRAADLAGDVCRADFGGAYLSSVKSRAEIMGVGHALDAVVERMEVAS